MRFVRENSIFVTTLYVLCGYLASRNNERVEDSMSIRLTAVVLYAVIVSIKIQDFLSESSEPPHIIFALPVKKRELYFSLFIPAVSWMMHMALIFIFFAAITQIDAEATFGFWLRASVLSLIFVIAALNNAFASYQDDKAGKKRLFIWGV